jgi:hypothetical protein
MYRIFSAPNGFRISFVRITMAHNLSVEQTTGQRVYAVADPADYGGRVLLACQNPVLMLSLAVKQADVEPFTQPVLQSDYVEKWSDNAPRELNWKGRLLEKVGKSLPFLPAMISGYRDRRRASVRNTRAYKRLW